MKEFCGIYPFLVLFQRLIEHTPPGHPDFPLLKEAEKVMHDFAIKLGTVNESQHEEDQQATLKRLELLLITDVSYFIKLWTFDLM